MFLQHCLSRDGGEGLAPRSDRRDAVVCPPRCAHKCLRALPLWHERPSCVLRQRLRSVLGLKTPLLRCHFLLHKNDQVTKTGSGQAWEKLRKTRRPTPTAQAGARLITERQRWRTAPCSVHKRVFEPFVHKCDVFYQDRLGTNIGKAALKKDKSGVVSFLQERCSRASKTQSFR